MGSDRQARAARRLVGAAMLGLLAAGCVSVDLPEGFLELEAASGQFRATTPDDARLWVRTFDDPLDGSLAFWVESLRTDLVERRRYEAVGDPETVRVGGVEGRVMEFETSVGGLAVRYLVGVWVKSGRIAVLEFCARHDEWDKRIAGVRACLPSLRF